MILHTSTGNLLLRYVMGGGGGGGGGAHLQMEKLVIATDTNYIPSRC